MPYKKDRYSAVKGAPTSLVFLWFFSLLFAPLCGWFLTFYRPLLYDDFLWRISVRAMLSFLPLVVYIKIYFFIFVFSLKNREKKNIIIYLIPMALTLLVSASGLSAARDAISGAVFQDVIVVAYKENAWQKGKDCCRKYGTYRARLSNGNELNFICPPICMLPVGKPVRIMYLKTMELIIEVGY